MSKMKSTKIFKMLIVAGLMILPVFLGACGAASDSAEAPLGLRSEALDDLVDPETSEFTGPSGGSVDNAPEDEDSVDGVAETSTGGVTPGRNGYNNQARDADRSAHVFDPAIAAELTAAEAKGLIYMREEEKLARDVYLALYEQWGTPVFQNIAGSEQTHMDSVLMLLDQYELTDPVAGKGAGEFTEPLFQSLYEQLVAQGSLSQTEALKVGATIEELDIVDLEERLAQTNNETIVQVYSNLSAGSENHLRAFVSNLERQTGEVYQPSYLDQDAYQVIMAGAPVRGGGNGGNGGGNGGGSNGGNGNGRRNGQGGNA